MSSGSKVVNNTTRYTTLGCGTAYVGYESTKTWSGADGPRSEEHEYTMTFVESSNGIIHWRLEGYPEMDATGTIVSCFGGFQTPDLDFPDNAIANLVIKNEEKFKGHAFNAAVNLAELNESISMIGNTARVLAKSFLALRRGDASAAIKALNLKASSSRVKDVEWKLRDSAADAWLGLTYGWQPLVYSVRDAADAAAANLGPRRTRVQSRFKVRVPALPTTNVRVGGFREIGCNLIFKIEEEARYTSLQEFGFTSPELVAWELMPYSFVVDWFYPIGNFLQARGTLSSLKGTFIKSLFDVTAIESIGLRNGYVLLSGKARYKAYKLERTVGAIGSLPLPAPSLKNPFSASHVTSALSLLQKAFGR